MKIIKDIFARIWALWGILSFAATFLIIFIPSMCCYLIPEPKSSVVFRNIAKIWMDVWLFLIGCPVKIKGAENFAVSKAYIVTCNHNALLDIPLSAPYIPGPNKTIAKASFAKAPLFGWFYRKGSVLLDRNSDKSRRKSYDAMKKVLQMGMHMCIYPEGTRNRTKEPLKIFYDGAFKLAVDTQTSIIPAVIFHTKEAMPIDRSFYLLPIRLEMHFLAPVSSAGISSKELKEKVFILMRDHYLANQ